jgi:hypothetical protein
MKTRSCGLNHRVVLKEEDVLEGIYRLHFQVKRKPYKEISRSRCQTQISLGYEDGGDIYL